MENYTKYPPFRPETETAFCGMNIQGVNKVRRHYFKIHSVLNNVMIFAKVCICDIDNV